MIDNALFVFAIVWAVLGFGINLVLVVAGYGDGMNVANLVLCPALIGVLVYLRHRGRVS